jgi:gamma-glutamylcyclotransferase (GGCT)/AIG2-like uncharacterized protein YtfP
MSDQRGQGHLYFAYGSNLDPAQMGRRCPGAAASGSAALRSWGFRIGERGVATIVPSEHEVVWGGLWTVDDDHVEALDVVEGVALGIYRRDTVTVAGPGGLVDALVYIEAFEGPGRPRDGYLEGCLSGAEWFELPESYRRDLRTRWG